MYVPSNYPQIRTLIDDCRVQVQAAYVALGNDPELAEVRDLLDSYRTQFE